MISEHQLSSIMIQKGTRLMLKIKLFDYDKSYYLFISIYLSKKPLKRWLFISNIMMYTMISINMICTTSLFRTPWCTQHTQISKIMICITHFNHWEQFVDINWTKIDFLINLKTSLNIKLSLKINWIFFNW